MFRSLLLLSFCLLISAGCFAQKSEIEKNLSCLISIVESSDIHLIGIRLSAQKASKKTDIDEADDELFEVSQKASKIKSQNKKLAAHVKAINKASEVMAVMEVSEIAVRMNEEYKKFDQLLKDLDKAISKSSGISSLDEIEPTCKNIVAVAREISDVKTNLLKEAKNLLNAIE